MGETNIPLPYVVRRESAVPDHATDLATNYPLVQDEMIAQARHVNGAGAVDVVYELDNRHVCTIMSNFCRYHKC